MKKAFKGLTPKASAASKGPISTVSITSNNCFPMKEKVNTKIATTPAKVPRPKI